MLIFPGRPEREREMRKKEAEVGERRKEVSELATAVSSDRSADRTLLRRATREKRRRQVRKRGGVLARQETVEGTQRAERTAILIDDLSLNPLQSLAGGVAARSRSRRAGFLLRER